MRGSRILIAAAFALLAPLPSQAQEPAPSFAVVPEAASPLPTAMVTSGAPGYHAGLVTPRGALTLRFVDLTIPARGWPIMVTRNYARGAPNTGLGPDWAWSLGLRVSEQRDTATLVILEEDGTESAYQRAGDGEFAARAGRLSSRLYALPDGHKRIFDDGSWEGFDPTGRLVRRTGINGAGYRVDWRDDGTLLALVHDDGQRVEFTTAEGRITSFTDEVGRVWRFDYDATGRLTGLTNPAEGITGYTYDDAARLAGLTLVDGSAIAVTYDVNSRVATLAGPGSLKTSFDHWGAPDEGTIVQTMVDASGLRRRLEIHRDAVAPDSFSIVSIDPGGIETIRDFRDGNLDVSVNGIWVGGLVNDSSARTTTLLTGDGTSLLQAAADAEPPMAMPDARGLPLLVTDGGASYWQNYDAVGRVIARMGPSGVIERYVLDALDRTIAVTIEDEPWENFSYDPAGRLLRWDKVDGTWLGYAYSFEGQVARIEGSGMVPQTIGYDAGGRVTQLDDGVSLWTARFDSSGRSIGLTNQAGQSLVVEYNEIGVPTAVTDTAGLTTYLPDPGEGVVTDSLGRRRGFVTDADGRVFELGPLGSTTTTLATEDGQFVTETVDADGSSSTTRTDANGALLAIEADGGRPFFADVDENGRITQLGDPRQPTTLQYDEAGLLTKRIGPTGIATIITHDEKGDLIQIASPFDSLELAYGEDGIPNRLEWHNGEVLEREVDALGRPLRLIRTGPLGDVHVETLAYDELGRVTEQVLDGVTRRYAYGENETTMSIEGGDIAQTWVEHFDPVTRTTTVVAPDQTETIVTYDAAGRMVASRSPGQIVQLELNPEGGLETISVDGQQRDATGGPMGGPVRSDTFAEEGPDGVARIVVAEDRRGGVWELGYDYRGLLVRSTDPLGGVTSITRNQAGATTARIDPEGRAYVVGFDDLGRPVSTGIAGGWSVANAWDGNQPVGISFSGGATLWTETDPSARQVVAYGNDAELARYGFDPLGRLSAVSSATGTASFTYDVLGNITSETDQFGRTILYRYDAIGRLAAMVLPEGDEIGFAYEGGNQVQQTGPDGRLTTTRYEPAQARFEVGLADGAELDLALANGGGIAAVDVTTTAGSTGLRVERDAAYAVIGLVTDGQRDAVTLDPLGRMIGYAPAGAAAQAWTYDGSGNLLTAPDGKARVYDEAYRLTRLGDDMATYDADGRLTQLGDSRFDYDPVGRLIRATDATGLVTELAYDALGRLVEKRSGGSIEQYLYANGRLIAVYDGAGQRQVLLERSSTIPGLVRIHDAAGVRSLVPDQLGTPILSVADGEVSRLGRYGPWGEAPAAGDISHWVGFSGALELPEHKLVLFKHRAYSTELQRFLTPDPLGMEGSSNPYAYADLQPLGLVEELGLTSAKFGVGPRRIGPSAMVGFGTKSTPVAMAGADLSQFHEAVAILQNMANGAPGPAQQVAQQTIDVLNGGGLTIEVHASGGGGTLGLSQPGKITIFLDDIADSTGRRYSHATVDDIARNIAGVIAHEATHVIQDASPDKLDRAYKEAEAYIRQGLVQSPDVGYGTGGGDARRALYDKFLYAFDTQIDSYRPNPPYGPPHLPGAHRPGLFQLNETNVVDFVRQFHPGMAEHDILRAFRKAHQESLRGGAMELPDTKDRTGKTKFARADIDAKTGQALDDMLARARVAEYAARHAAASATPAAPHPAPQPNTPTAAAATPHVPASAVPNAPRPAFNPPTTRPIPPIKLVRPQPATPPPISKTATTTPNTPHQPGASAFNDPNAPRTTPDTPRPGTPDGGRPTVDRPAAPDAPRANSPATRPRPDAPRAGRPAAPVPERTHPPVTDSPRTSGASERSVTPERPARPTADPAGPRPVDPDAPRPVEPDAPRPTNPDTPRPTEPDAPRPTDTPAPRPTDPDTARPVDPDGPRPVDTPAPHGVEAPHPPRHSGHFDPPDLSPGAVPPPNPPHSLPVGEVDAPHAPHGLGGWTPSRAFLTGVDGLGGVFDLYSTLSDIDDYWSGRMSTSRFLTNTAMTIGGYVLPWPLSGALAAHQIGGFIGGWLANRLMQEAANGDRVAQALIDWFRRSGWINANDPTFVAVGEAMPPGLGARSFSVSRGASPPLQFAIWSAAHREVTISLRDAAGTEIIPPELVSLVVGADSILIEADLLSGLAMGGYTLAADGVPLGSIEVVEPAVAALPDLTAAALRVEVDLRDTRLAPTDLSWTRFDQPRALLDGAVAAGDRALGDWVWSSDETAPGSGSVHANDPVGSQIHYVLLATPHEVVTGENIVQYIWIDPAAPPRQVVLQYYDEDLSGAHRLSLGEDLVAFDDRAGSGFVEGGNLPERGSWQRLRIPVDDLGLAGRRIAGLGFAVESGVVRFGPTTMSGAEDSAPQIVAVSGRDESGAPQADLVTRVTAASAGRLTLYLVSASGARTTLFAGDVGLGRRVFWWQGDAGALAGATLEASLALPGGEPATATAAIPGNPALVARLLYPPGGAVVRQTVPVFGQAGGADFDHFLVEYRVVGTEAWTLLNRGEAASVSTDFGVEERIASIMARQLRGTVHGNLASLHTGSALHAFPFAAADPVLPSGQLEIRLTSFDAAGNSASDSTIVRLGEVVTGQDRSIIPSPDGLARLVVPPFSLPTGMGTLSIDLVSQERPSEAPAALGPVYGLAPDGLDFAAPVRIGFRDDAARSVAIIGADGSWRLVPGTREDDWLVASIPNAVGSRFYATAIEASGPAASITAAFAPWIASADLLAARSALPTGETVLVDQPLPLDKPLALILGYSATEIDGVALLLRHEGDALVVPLGQAIPGLRDGFATSPLGNAPGERQTALIRLDRLLAADVATIERIDLVRIHSAAWNTYLADPVGADRFVLHSLFLGTLPPTGAETWSLPTGAQWRLDGDAEWRDGPVTAEAEGWHWVEMNLTDVVTLWPILRDGSAPDVGGFSPAVDATDPALRVSATLDDPGAGIDIDSIAASINGVRVPHEDIGFDPVTGSVEMPYGRLAAAAGIRDGSNVTARLDVADRLGLAAAPTEWSWTYRAEPQAIGPLRQLSLDGGQFPAWRGHSLVFAAPVEGQFDLFEVPATGGTAVRLTKTPQDETAPAPHPQGDVLAFLRGDSLILLEAGVERSLATGLTDPAWLDADTLLAGRGNSVIGIAAADAAESVLCTAAPGAQVFHPRPVGNMVAFTQAIYHRTLWLCNPRTGTLTPLSADIDDPETADADATASGSEALIYARNDGRGGLWRLALGREAREPLTQPGGSIDRRPVLSPDGKVLLFESDRTGRPEIWRLDLPADARLLASAAIVPAIGGTLILTPEMPDGVSVANWRLLDATGAELVAELTVAAGADGSFIWTPATGLAAGDVIVEAQLSNGVTTRAPVTLDATGPVLSVGREADGEPVDGTTPLLPTDRLLVTASDDGVTVVDVTYALDGAAPLPITGPIALDGLAAPAMLILRATDPAGNVTNLELVLNLPETEPPPTPEPTPQPGPAPERVPPSTPEPASWPVWLLIGAAVVGALGAILMLRRGRSRP